MKQTASVKKSTSTTTKKRASEAKPDRRRSWNASTIKYLTQPELKSLFHAITDKRDFALFLLAYRHGLRVSEVPLLYVDDIDLQQLRITIHRRKGSVSGVHPMQQDEIKAVKALLRTRKADSPTLFVSNRLEAISRRQIDHLMKKYGERAGIPENKRYFHTLKHSIATHLLDAGADLRFVQDWIGHSAVKNTVIYAQLTNRRRDEEARRVFQSRHVV